MSTSTLIFFLVLAFAAGACGTVIVQRVMDWMAEGEDE